DHSTASKIQRWNNTAKRSVQIATLAPDHMRQGEINKRRPKNREREHGAKLHSFSKGACNQSRSDDCKHQLEEHKSLLRYGRGVIRVRHGPHAAQKRIAEIA